MQLPLLGGDVCLDFVNTAEHRGGAAFVEFLSSYAGLAAWCCHAGLITSSELQRLHKLAAGNGAAALQVLRQALALREALYRVFAGIVKQQKPSAAALKPLNAALARFVAARAIAPSGASYRWQWPAGQGRLDTMLGPLALAAAELMTSQAALQQLRQCPNCGWLFLDTSRNHARRWCSMQFCGSKMKSRRQYERKIGRV
jgi:predicted RNA-binding Zn ribbon-like protein